MNMGMVVLMGVVTVFIVLICLILIIKIMSAIVGSFVKTETAPAVQTTSAPAKAPVAQPSVNKQQLIAAIGAAIAEDMGTDVSHIKIHSIKKI